MPASDRSEPLIVQLAVTPAGEVLALDTEGRLWCSFPKDRLSRGIEADNHGYLMRLMPVRVEFKRWHQ